MTSRFTSGTRNRELPGRHDESFEKLRGKEGKGSDDCVLLVLREKDLKRTAKNGWSWAL